MYHEQAMSNENSQNVKLVNVVRVLIYIYAIVMQVFWDWVGNPSGFTIDPMIVLVPLFLAIMDCTLIYWSENHPRRFWNILPFSSILAILVAINTIWITFSEAKWYAPYFDLVVFGVVVILASLYEMILWIQRNQMLLKELDDSNSKEIRTYEVQK